jgi:leucine-rich repeat protein SHOC2
LKRLDLRHNKLEGDVPLVIYQLSSLMELYMTHNKLTRLMSGLGNLRNLVHLDFSQNKLTEVPSELGELKALQKLMLKSNHLTSIPEAISDCTSLSILDLRYFPSAVSVFN